MCGSKRLRSLPTGLVFQPPEPSTPPSGSDTRRLNIALTIQEVKYLHDLDDEKRTTLLRSIAAVQTSERVVPLRFQVLPSNIRP